MQVTTANKLKRYSNVKQIKVKPNQVVFMWVKLNTPRNKCKAKRKQK